MADDLRLGGKIRARRTALGLTLAEVADKADLSIPYVSNLERGRGNPTVDALRSLADVLDTSLSDLLGDQVPEGEIELLDLQEKVALAEAPKSLLKFGRSSKFIGVVERLSEEQCVPIEDMRRRLLIAMASAPRRSASEPTDEDWRRLLDAYSLILREK